MLKTNVGSAGISAAGKSTPVELGLVPPEQMAKIAAGACAALRQQVAEARRAAQTDPAVRNVTLGEAGDAYRLGFRGEAVYHIAAALKHGQQTQRVPVASTSRGTSRERRNPQGRAGRKSASRGDPDREPPLTRLQLAHLARSEALRARLQPEWRECPACLREQEPEEFRGRRVCRSCESKARRARFEVAA